MDYHLDGNAGVRAVILKHHLWGESASVIPLGALTAAVLFLKL